jgi:hypothetical protein
LTFVGELPTELIDRYDMLIGRYGRPRVGVEALDRIRTTRGQRGY